MTPRHAHQDEDGRPLLKVLFLIGSARLKSILPDPNVLTEDWFAAAESLDEARDLLSSWHPVLCIVDSLHPGVGVLEVIKQLSSDYPQCRFLVLLGDESCELRLSDLVSSGAAGFVAPGDDLDQVIHKAQSVRAEQDDVLRRQRLESVGIMASGVAHDFNNILMSVLGYSGIIRDMLDPSHPAVPMIRTVEQAAERATGLSGELMAYARGTEQSKIPLRLVSELEGLLRMIRPKMPRDVELATDFQPGIKCVYAEPTQLQQVLMNLVINAGEAISSRTDKLGSAEFRGKIRLHIAECEYNDQAALAAEGVAGIDPGTYIRLTVSDNGCGMDKRTINRIFEPFFTTKQTGHGLGLAAVLDIVREHGGSLVAESVPDEGTTFVLHLPATDEVPVEISKTPGLVPSGRGVLLFIDSELVVRQVALLTLANRGYQVLLAKDLIEGMTAYQTYFNQLDMVILNIDVPGRVWLECLQTMRDARPAVRLLVTGDFGASTAEGCRVLDYADAYLMKPYTPESIGRTVRDLLDDRPS